MLADLALFRLYDAMARHAAERQRVSATNIAQANTPGYRARSLESFEDFLAREAAQFGDLQSAFRETDAGTPAAPNGNTVSLEAEAFASADAASQHELALTVYAKSLDLLRTALGKPR